MSLIVSETYSSVTEKGVKLAASQIARKFKMGSWVTLRIGARVWCSDSGAGVNPAVFHFGLCHGTTNLPQDASVDHFVGIRTKLITGAAIPTLYREYSANNYVTYSVEPSVTNWRTIQKIVGTTITGLTTSAPNTYQYLFNGPVGTGNFRHKALIMEYTRVSATQMTIKWWSPTWGGATTNVMTNAKFWQLLFAANPSNVDSGIWHYDATNGTYAITNAAVDESTDGELDAITIGWNFVSPYVAVTDIAVVKMA